MNEYEFVLPWPPTVNTYWRRRGSQYYISDKGQKYRKDVQQIIRQLRLDIFTKSRLRITIIAEPPDSRRRDLDNYVFGMTLMSLGRKHGRSDCWAGRVLQKAEGVIEGMLIMQGVKLEMDRYVEREPSGSQASQFAGRAGN